MKAYSIGREAGCNIVINDSTDVISRRHATLNVESSGKMTIVDTSRNGTYVNGIRITPNTPFPVTRKDKVSFAHVAPLDWNLIPKETSAMRYSIIAAVAVLVVICGIVGYSYINDGGGNEPTPSVIADSIMKKQQEEQLRKDSIKKAIDDSIKHRTDSIKHREDSIKHREDSIRDAKKKAGSSKPAQSKEKQDSAKDSTKNSRRLGN